MNHHYIIVCKLCGRHDCPGDCMKEEEITMRRILDATNLRMREVAGMLPLRLYPHLGIESVGGRTFVGLE